MNAVRNLIKNIDSHRDTLSEDELVEYMERLSSWCEAGSEDIPGTPDKADYWHRIAKNVRTAGAASADRHNDEKAPDIQQKRERIVWICMGKMIEIINRKTQADGICAPFCLQFDYPGSSNIGVLHLEHSKLDKRPYAFKISAIRCDTDMLISNYIKFGTLNDIIAYLSDRGNLQEMAFSYQELSESVDKHWQKK